MPSKVIVAVSVALTLITLTVMALVTRLLLHKNSKHTTTEDAYITDASVEPQHQLANISSSWKRLFVSKQRLTKGRWVPNLSGIIKAGDEGLFTSALFAELHGQPGDISLDVLYEAFAKELQSRSFTERSAYSGAIAKFLLESKRSDGGLGRTKSVTHRRTSSMRQDVTSKSSRKSMDLSVAEKGLSRSFSTRRPVPMLVPMHNGLQDERIQKTAQNSWMKEGQKMQHQSNRSGIRITASELAALSIVLGSPLNISAESTGTTSNASALGISISSTPISDGKLQISLHQHKRSISQQHAQGSGYSPLLAKHLAAGFLPYSQHADSINSILITKDTLEAIRAGASLYCHPSNTPTPQSQYLQTLPTSRPCNFHILAPSTELHTSSTLLDAISALPFTGGLPPLASTSFITTTNFIASGGLPTGKLLQRLEALVDRVHHHSPHLNVFGPLYEQQHIRLLYRERERLAKLASSAHVEDTLVDKAARMSRYVTLLERLMAMVPDMKPNDVLSAVQDALRVEIQRSYAEAVAAHANSTLSFCTSSANKSEIDSNRDSIAHSHRTNRTSVISNVTSPRRSTDLPANLGKQIEHLLKLELPLSIESIAFVARMVLVAWTVSVEGVAWEDGETGWRLPDFKDVEGKGEIVLC
jgi:hypothetical protein